MATFQIYFSDLNEDAQKRLMEAVKIEHPDENNWDIDLCPLAEYEYEDEDDEEE